MRFPLYSNHIWLFQKPVDFRCGKNSLITQIANEQKNPMDGIYLFLNKRGDKLKCLCWHKNGFLVIWKELEHARFSLSAQKERKRLKLTEEEFIWLCAGLPWEEMSQWGAQSFKKFS